jgi:nucleoid-associated protein YgaU
MFESKSRYAEIENTTLTTEKGRVILYKRRRFLPQRDEMSVLQEVAVVAGDRLDLIASRTLGDPEQYWLICDANNAMYPPDLIDLEKDPDKVLRISVPRR